MLTLAIDTAANFCSACVWDDAAQRVLGGEERDIGRGHAEQLVGTAEAALVASKKDFSDIGRVAVAVGPGSFTGIRVGVAAARGFGLALSVPVVGVTTLQALAADARAEIDGPVTIAVHGGRGQFFMQSFAVDGAPLGDPLAVDAPDAVSQVPEDAAYLAGNAAAEVAAALGLPVTTVIDRATGSIATIARLAETSGLAPVPLYLRGADAKPQTGFALPHAKAENTP